MDTGAELLTIPVILSHTALVATPLHYSLVVLCLYDGSVLPTKGVITVTVKQDSQTVMGSFISVENVDNQLSLLGCDCIIYN